MNIPFMNVWFKCLLYGGVFSVGALYLIFRGPRIVSLLIFKYLRRRRIAWVSLVAVTLCTTMVIVIISVMGGWLRMFRSSFHGLSGDVLVQARTLSGFPYYDDMIAEIRKLPEVEDAVPIVHAHALIDIANMKQEPVQVFGYPRDPQTGIIQVGRVNAFPESLYNQYQQYADEADSASDPKVRDAARARAEHGKANPTFDLRKDIDYRVAFLHENPHAPPRLAEAATKYPGMICGDGLLEIAKDKDGKIAGREDFKFKLPAKLTVIAIPAKGGLDMTSKSDHTYWIIDDSRTGVYQYDNNTVYVPFDVLQRDLSMDQQQGTTADGAAITLPPRTSEIDVKVKPGVDLDLARTNIDGVVERVMDQRTRMALDKNEPIPDFANLKVVTWEDNQRLFLGAVEKEKLLVTILFGIVSVVAIFLIFCIFFMIVTEKTRDIGIVKSVGATNMSVAGIFLGYGLIIGLIGGALGLLFGFLIVHNINGLHQWLGDRFGVKVWDPQVYAFDTIPNTLNPKEVVIIVLVAIFSSVCGAILPAFRAARLHPIEALRWE